MKKTIILRKTGIVLRCLAFTAIQLAAFFFIMRTRVTKAPLSFAEQIYVLSATVIAAGFTVLILWKKTSPYSALIAASEAVGSVTVFPQAGLAIIRCVWMAVGKTPDFLLNSLTAALALTVVLSAALYYAALFRNTADRSSRQMIQRIRQQQFTADELFAIAANEKHGTLVRLEAIHEMPYNESRFTALYAESTDEWLKANLKRMIKEQKRLDQDPDRYHHRQKRPRLVKCPASKPDAPPFERPSLRQHLRCIWKALRSEGKKEVRNHAD